MAPKNIATGVASSVSKGAKKLPPAPLSVKTAKKVAKHPHFEKTPRTYRIGRDIQPPRDVTRFVRWPKYIRLQRQKAILTKRLKVPPALNQFNHTLNANQATQLLRLLGKYKPETRHEKKQRLMDAAQKQAAGGEKGGKTAGVSGGNVGGKKPVVIKYGLNHVTDLIEIKKAKLVVIAHDVEPIELVTWVPALCRKQGIPYCIIKGKSRLGKLIHKKKAAVIAVDAVRKEDQGEFENFCFACRGQFNDNVEVRRKWGGGLLGIKSQHVQQKKEKMIAIEQAKKLGMNI